MMLKKEDLCPCQTGKPYGECCRPFLENTCNAPTAEALMRSRFTANVLRDIAYLQRTWHVTQRPASIDRGKIPDWTDLTIIRTGKGQAGDSEGLVEFLALATGPVAQHRLHERSRFVKEEGVWYYLDGEILEAVTEPSPSRKAQAAGVKTGRNEPCPCGSGLKYKKCCIDKL